MSAGIDFNKISFRWAGSQLKTTSRKKERIQFLTFDRKCIFAALKSVKCTRQGNI